MKKPGKRTGASATSEGGAHGDRSGGQAEEGVHSKIHASAWGIRVPLGKHLGVARNRG